MNTYSAAGHWIAPLLFTKQAARLVPASIIAAWSARAEARAFARDIKRLEELGPHLLDDIGLGQVAAGVYAIIETGEPLV